MVDRYKMLVRDALLRVLGLVLLTFCWLTMIWLFHSVATHDPRDADVMEFVAATIGFLCFSSGAALTLFGIHVFDDVEVSQRWARTSRMP